MVAVLVGAATLAWTAVSPSPKPTPAPATPERDLSIIFEDSIVCDKFGTATLGGGKYIVQNNVWGADTQQCLELKANGGFAVSSADHNSDTKGKPAAYPSVYAGCHYGKCSAESTLPMPANDPRFAGLETGVEMSYPPDGSWNAAYDLWFDPEPRTDGQNQGAEIMIWLEQRGEVRPIGRRVGTVNLDGRKWSVWFGNDGWNVVSYVAASPLTSITFKPDTFYSDAVARGYARREWYLTSVQAGFEPWVGGTGLAVESFSFVAPNEA